MTESPKRCGVVAIIGSPNAGKSTLLNALVGSKVAIVTPKVQTTRNRIRGICAYENTQLIFVDTPGIFAAEADFEKAMVDAAWNSVKDADAVLFLLDASAKFGDRESNTLDKLAARKPKAVFAALNKVDIAPKEKLFELATALDKRNLFSQILMISALKDDGLTDLKFWLAKSMPEGPFLYPADEMTDMPERLLAAEITREKLFMALHQELPYSLHVETESWEESGERTAIRQVIYVQRESQKKIIIGAKGEMLKKIGTESRMEMNKLLDRRIHLELFVKVREGWKNNAESYRYLGLDFKQ